MSYGRAIATNTLWMIGGKALTTVLSLALVAALAQSLGVFRFGEYTTAFAFLTFFGVIADFGFLAIFVRELAKHPEKEEEITGNLLALRAVFGVIVYAVSAAVIWLFPYSLTVKWGVIILAAASFLLSTNNTLIGVFQARHEMSKAVVGDIVSRAVLLVAALYGLGRGWDLIPIFWLYLGANFLNLLITYWLIRRRISLRLSFDFARWQYFFREAWPLGVITVLSIIYFRIGTIILSVEKTPVDVGIYGAPFKIFEFLTIVPAIFMGNVFPVITRLKDQPERAARFVQAALDTLLILGVGTSVGLALLAKPVIGLVAGAEFQTTSTYSFANIPITAVHVLALLSVALLAIFLAQLWSYVVIAHSRQQVLIRSGIWAVVLNVVLNLILIPQGSYFAATLVTILTEVFILIFWQRAAQAILPMSPNFRQLPKILISGVVMAGVVWLLREYSLVIPIVAGAGVYLGLLLVWRVIPAELATILRSRNQTGGV